MTNYKNRHIQRLTQLLVLSMLCLLAACSSGDEEPANQSQTKCKVRLYVNVNDRSPRMGGTRALWAYSGSDFENYLDINDFQVYLFSAEDDTLIAHLTYPKTSQKINFSFEPTDDETIYQIEFCVDEIIEKTGNNLANFKIVMLANWGGSYPANLQERTTTIANLTEDFDECVGYFDPKADLEKIPFFGVQEYENVEFLPESVVEIKDKPLCLLRALAKIEVYDHPDSEFHIKEVKLQRYNEKFYMAPKSVTNSSSYTNQFPGLSLPQIYNEWEIAEPIVFKEIQENSKKRYIIYVPEYNNTERNWDDDNPTSIVVTYEEDNKEYPIDFKYYQEYPVGAENVGDPYDLRRNYWYEIIVKRGWQLEVQVAVIPFTPVEVDPNYGLLRENVTGYVIGKDENNKDCWYDGTYYDNSDPEPVPFYLGPSGKDGQLVSINGVEYMLVYTDYERTAANLDHFFEKKTDENGVVSYIKHLLTPEAITGYQTMKDAHGYDMYVNNLKQRVWLDSEVKLKCCHTLNEWERYEYNLFTWGYTENAPRYWFDILGNRYSWDDGDTPEKRKSILKEWVDYLE